MATWRVFTRTVYTAIAVMILMASPDVSFAAEQPSCEAPPPHIVVVGSVNVDLTVKVARPPALEETVTATDPRVSVAVGGKGANQAVAAARLVAGSRPVRFVGQFGGDSHASMLEEDLVANGVDVSLSGRHPDLPSGTGLVMLSPGGEASSVVVGGANSAWPENDDELVSTMVRAARGAAVMLLQREVPDRVNLAAAAAAKAAGVPIVVDAGGVDAPIPAALLEAADYLCPNESELARLTRMPTSTDDEAVAAGLELVARGAKRVLVTLGARGAMVIGATGVLVRHDALPVPGGEVGKVGEVVDGTAAGDAFRAALAVAVAEGVDVVKDSRGLALAAAAGAHAVSVPGAVPSLPTRDNAENLLPEHRRLPAPAETEACETDAALRDDECPLRFGSRLNSMKERPDLWRGRERLDVLGMVRRLSEVEGIDLVDFNYPQHLDGRKPKAVTGALRAAGLAAGAVAVRFPASRFRAGAFTNPDPSVRAAAVDVVAGACAWAQSLDASAGVIVWPQFDGYDYHLQVNYSDAWRRGVGAIRAALDRDECEGVKVSYEFKPTDPSSRFALVPSTAAALALVRDVNRPGRFGLTLDAGHLVAAGENPAQSAAMVADAGALFGFHLGDVHSKLAAEDGLAFGSVHAPGALELVFWLRASKYRGHAYFDTFPEAEDPTREAAYNVRAFKRMWSWAARLERDGIRDVLLNHDAMTSLEMQEGLIDLTKP